MLLSSPRPSFPESVSPHVYSRPVAAQRTNQKGNFKQEATATRDEPGKTIDSKRKEGRQDIFFPNAYMETPQEHCHEV